MDTINILYLLLNYMLSIAAATCWKTNNIPKAFLHANEVLQTADKNKRANSAIEEEPVGNPRIITSVLVEFFPSRQELFDMVDKYLEISELPKHYRGFNKGNSLELMFDNSVIYFSLI